MYKLYGFMLVFIKDMLVHMMATSVNTKYGSVVMSTLKAVVHNTFFLFTT